MQSNKLTGMTPAVRRGCLPPNKQSKTAVAPVKADRERTEL